MFELTNAVWLATGTEIELVNNNISLKRDLAAANERAERAEAMLTMATKFSVDGRVEVCYRDTADGVSLWAIMDGMLVFNRNHEWVYESPPSKRTDAFKANTRYTRDEAITLARAICEGRD